MKKLALGGLFALMACGGPGSKTPEHAAAEVTNAFASALRAEMNGVPVFVSVDMDVLDPSILPGTGNPEPGGPTYRELREALLGLAGARIVGIDFVEVAPVLDSSGLSPIVAAELARDVILGLLVP